MLLGHFTPNPAFFRSLFSPDCRKCLNIGVGFTPCGPLFSRISTAELNLVSLFLNDLFHQSQILNNEEPEKQKRRRSRISSRSHTAPSSPPIAFGAPPAGVRGVAAGVRSGRGSPSAWCMVTIIAPAGLLPAH
jgi:hypothetical protein